jgi:translation elongation factor P/translation initiation factor 5A
MENKLTNYVDASTIKIGDYIMIGEHPCKCIEINKTRTSFFSSGKGCYNIQSCGVDIYQNSKHKISFRSTDQIEVPHVEKEYCQILCVEDDNTALLLFYKDHEFRDDIKIDINSKDKITEALNNDKIINCTSVTIFGHSFIDGIKIYNDTPSKYSTG